MKKILVIIIISFLTIGIKAQPTITNNVLPVIGDTVLMSFDSTLIAPGVSGANVTWDFTTTLHQDFFFQRIYLNPLNTAYSATFPNAKLCRTDGIGSAYSYWDNTNSTKSVCYGFVETNNYTQHYNNLPINYYKFPISYGNTYTDSVSAVTNPGNLVGPGKYTFSADAWGTIKLPNKTVSNVLRTKSVLYIGDSSAGVNSYSLTTEYSWYQASKKEPLLVISSVIINHAMYKKYVLYDITSSNGIAEAEPTAKFEIMPNPSKDLITINVESLKLKDAFDVSIYDILGKKVFAKAINNKENTVEIDVRFLTKGVYILKLTDGKQSHQHKFIKE